MSAELIGIISVGVAIAGLLWKMRRDLDEDLDRRLGSLDSKIDSIDRRIDTLVQEHHALAREVSEFRGEMRGRLQRREQAPPFELEETAVL